MSTAVRAAILALGLSVSAPAIAQEPAGVEPAPDEQGTEAPTGFTDQLDDAFGSYVVAPIEAVLFWDVFFWDNGQPDDVEFPVVVLWLILGAVFFTLRMQFINVRAFGHALAVTTGRYDRADDPGEVSHFRALASALSATVGLGNIAGVAIAVGTGGPGATFWMIVAGLLGMSSKFVECTLGQLYRNIDAQGHVLGGPMRYLAAGLAERGWPHLGKVLAVAFSVMCIGGSFGGGNMFQANQSFLLIAKVAPGMEAFDWLFGLLLAAAVGVVIIGGIRRIATVAGYLVPVMCAVYVLAGIFVLATYASQVPHTLGRIVSEAFTPQAGFGGALGVLITGFRRAAFSNEAGVGSASIAHSAAATDEPVREGIVALLEPFIDTVVICTMTALVVVITNTYTGGHGDGAAMTSAAFAQVLPWFPLVLTFAVLCFAFSTMISWSYYGERCWTFLFGADSSLIYRLLFLVFTFLGPIVSMGHVVTFSDLMILGMAFPNILGAIILSGHVKRALDEYWTRYRNGHMLPVTPSRDRSTTSG